MVNFDHFIFSTPMTMTAITQPTIVPCSLAKKYIRVLVSFAIETVDHIGKTVAKLYEWCVSRTTRRRINGYETALRVKLFLSVVWHISNVRKRFFSFRQQHRVLALGLLSCGLTGHRLLTMGYCSDDCEHFLWL